MRPGVGIGVIILNKKGEILVGKRKGSHSPFYSIPGGHLELGETFEQAAIKEIQEETGLLIQDPKVFAVSNNLETYDSEGIHHVSINMIVESYEGIPTVMEKEKCAEWIWVNPSQLPEPHFEASKKAVECFLEKKIYKKR